MGEGLRIISLLPGATEMLVALGATQLRSIAEEGLDHYAVAMADPEGNEFDIN